MRTQEKAKTGTTVLEGVNVATGRKIAVEIRGETIGKVMPSESSGDVWIAPGFVDLQLNGFRGLDFDARPLREDVPGKVARELWKDGVTTFYAAVITNPDEVIEQNVRAIGRACERDSAAKQSIAGLHIEGPFISPQDGARGAHDEKWVKPPNWPLFQRWQDASGGRIKITTVSPEYPESTNFIEKCVQSGVVVSIGHTSATPEQIRDAVAAGARMSTHLGNGSHAMIPRHRNYIWEQLAQDDLWACLIADGFHLPDAPLKVFLRVKGRQAIIVSDATAIAGLKPGRYTTPCGDKVVLTAEGKLHIAEDPQILAGSAQLLSHGVGHLVRSGITTLADAWEAGSTRPASFMGLPCGRGLAPGAPADLVVFKWDGKTVQILKTYKNGKLV